MTELQLITACQNNDPAAQRILYERFVGSMLTVCLRYVPRQDDAEEILSDAFLKCFKHIRQFTFQGEGSTRAWLKKIVTNECLMFLRKKKQLVIPIEDHVPETQTSDPETALDLIASRDILRWIQELPVGYRTVLNLYVFEDLSHKEIAALLDISVNTSKSQLFKARSLLQQKIAADNRTPFLHN